MTAKPCSISRPEILSVIRLTRLVAFPLACFLAIPQVRLLACIAAFLILPFPLVLTTFATSSSTAKTPALDAETLDFLLFHPPATNTAWLTDLSLFAGAGSADNVFRSDRQPPVNSLFAETRLEAYAFRPWPRQSGHLSALFHAEGRRYTELSEDPHEYQLFLRTELLHSPHPDISYGLSFTGLAVSLFDNPADHHERAGPANRVRFLAFDAQPRLTLRLQPQLKLHLNSEIKRSIDENPLEDFSQYALGFEIERLYAGGQNLTLGYQQQERFFDEREQRRLWGANLPGSRLRFTFHRAHAALDLPLAFSKRLLARSSFHFVARRDNGSGYFDYNQFGTRQSLLWQDTRWQFELSASLLHYRYADAWAAFNLGQQRRWDLFSVEASLRWQWTANAAILLRLYRENASSNWLDINQYTHFQIRSGLEWSF